MAVSLVKDPRAWVGATELSTFAVLAANKSVLLCTGEIDYFLHLFFVFVSSYFKNLLTAASSHWKHFIGRSCSNFFVGGKIKLNDQFE